MDFQVENISLIAMGNLTNIDSDEKPLGVVFVAFGITHMLVVVIPSVLLGSIILPLLVSSYKKTRNASTLIFIFIVLLCTLGPATYGFLMDVSFIADVPTLGGCSVPLLWLFYGTSQLTLTIWIAFLSVIQYVVIRRGNSKRLTIVTATVMAILFAICLAVSCLAFTRNYDGPFKLRGSFCGRANRTLFTNIRITSNVVFFLIPSIITVIVFASLSYRFVKQNTVDNAKFYKAILKILTITTVSTIVLRLFPFLGLFWFDLGPYSSLVQFVLELNYPLQLTVIITVHKVVKESFKQKVLSYFLKTNTDTPQVTSDAPKANTAIQEGQLQQATMILPGEVQSQWKG